MIPIGLELEKTELVQRSTKEKERYVDLLAEERQQVQYLNLEMEQLQKEREELGVSLDQHIQFVEQWKIDKR